MLTFLKITAIIVFISILLVATGHLFLSTASSGGLLAFVRHHSLWLMVWRYSCYTLIIALWPYFIAVLGRCQGWHADIIVYFQHQRLKVLSFFILIEILFVFNGVGVLFAHL